MKSLLLAMLAPLAALPHLLAQEAAPTPAPPVSTPAPGMAWEIDIRPAAFRPDSTQESPDTASPRNGQPPASAKPIRITGRCGEAASTWTVHFPGGNRRDFLLAGNRLFAWNEKTGKLSMPELRDGLHNEALAFEVSGFPGVGWVRKDQKPAVTMDPRSGAWRVTYLQEASPFNIVNEGTEDEYAVPTGPSVRVEATFDPATGLPLTAIVGNMLYTYRIDPRGGGDPELSSAFRQALEARLKREAALRAAIAREEKTRP
jgi:hypothetical protein